MKKYSITGSPNRSDMPILVPIYWGVLVMAALWFSAILTVPLWFRGGLSEKITAGLIRYFFSSICHQMPERSFHLCGHHLAVCARCTGIYGGFVLGMVLFPFLKHSDGKPTFPLWILYAAVLLNAAEWLLANGHIMESSNWIRCSTGLVLGGAMVFWVLPAIFQLAMSGTNSRGESWRNRSAN
jgi:uncharacterized membrane protein